MQTPAAPRLSRDLAPQDLYLDRFLPHESGGHDARICRQQRVYLRCHLRRRTSNPPMCTKRMMLSTSRKMPLGTTSKSKIRPRTPARVRHGQERFSERAPQAALAGVDIDRDAQERKRL